MQCKLGDGSVIVEGYAHRGAEVKTSQSGSEFTRFSLIVGKKDNGDNTFANCVAFYDVGRVAATIAEKDHVLVVGRIQDREYNGKQYRDLVCDWVGICAPKVSATAAGITDELPTAPVVDYPSEPVMTGDPRDNEAVDDYDDLPF